MKYLTEQQVDQFFAAVRAERVPHRRARDLCLYSLMLSYGLRALEVTLLRVQDVNLEADPPQLYVTRVKERRRRRDPVTGETRECQRPRRGAHYSLSDTNATLLRRWLRARTAFPTAEGSDRLFVSAKSGSISYNWLWKMTARYGTLAGLAHVHPHMFRHTCGAKLARAGRNAFVIQHRLGHASPESSVPYVALVGPDRLREDAACDSAIEGRDL